MKILENEDTWWSDLRWRIAIRLSVLAIRIAPEGTAKWLWLGYNKQWADVCKTAYYERYPELTK